MSVSGLLAEQLAAKATGGAAVCRGSCCCGRNCCWGAELLEAASGAVAGGAADGRGCCGAELLEAVGGAAVGRSCWRSSYLSIL